jgi:DNA (cytosine-5)-methyltransferase 1
MRINGLDLFSGIGGIALALHPWVQTVAYCEIEKYPQKVLLKNMENGNLDPAPIYPDVTTLKGKDLEHRIDIITGGFPCQDISVAGHGAGLAGERSGLFFEIVRLACELSPRYIFLENVPAITFRGGTAVVAELTKIGYECRWTTLSAKAVGANHRRERWWLLARRLDTHASSIGWRKGAHYPIPTDCKKPKQTNTMQLFKNLPNGKQWATEPIVHRLGHGIPNRLQRIKALGNSVVPLQARVAFEYLLKGTTP